MVIVGKEKNILGYLNNLVRLAANDSCAENEICTSDICLKKIIYYNLVEKI
jgi:hypothetical protein